MSADPYLAVTWVDPVTDCRGYVAIDRLIRGVAGGGLRMRRGCDAAEVAELASAMSRKEAVAYRPGSRYLPLGGAKGGIDFDPRDPEAKGVLRRYLEATKPLIQTCWGTGEDLGVRQDDLDELARELGLRSTVDSVLALVPDGADAGIARLDEGFAASERGIGLAELVGGYGVAEAALAAIDELGRPRAEATAVIQGFGSMGGATARYLADAGVRIVAVADIEGVVAAPEGLDVEALLRHRDRLGRIDRSRLGAGADERPGESWAAIRCDVLVPAAASYAIDSAEAAGIEAAAVVEAANLATVPDAERELAARGVAVVPDFVANLATNAWWWWTMFGDIEPTPAAAFDRISTVIGELIEETFERSRANGGTLRDAAERIADERGELAAAEADRVGAAA